jgi:hypothetical protein
VFKGSTFKEKENTMNMHPKYYKYPISFPREMGEYFESLLPKYPNKSPSKCVQAHFQPGFEVWLAKKRIEQDRSGHAERENQLIKTTEGLRRIIRVSENMAKYGEEKGAQP